MSAPLQQLLLQIVLILILARLCGLILRKLGQPQVIGEMCAGILLGPSVLGRFNDGHLMEAIFPPSGNSYLELFSQLGVILFMFLVGLEVDLTKIGQQGKAVLWTGISTMVFPFAAGLGISLFMWKVGYGAEKGGSNLGFVLFMATAFCITAFPVLARILTEANMLRSKVGLVAVTCAALNDICGWCLLGVVLAIAKGADGSTGGNGGGVAIFWIAFRTVGLAALYLVGMVVLVRPILRRLQKIFDVRGYLSADVVAILFILLTLSSLITDRIGIHALFGAFMLGAVMPSEHQFVAHLTSKLEDLATLLLLPLFFAFTGLRTDLGLLVSPNMWLMAGLVTLAATVGKVGGTYFAARRSSMTGRESLALGILMNTRGLMELVILNLALEAHAITDKVFSIMVVMTLITTAMTSPLLRLLYPAERRRRELLATADAEPAPGLRIVLAVARPAAVTGLVRAARLLLGGQPGTLWALHVDRVEDAEHRDEQADPLKLATDAARTLDVPLQTVNLVSEHFDKELLDLAERRHAGWIVLGWHKPVFDHSLLGRRAEAIMKNAAASVAVLVDKGLDDVKRVLVPYLGDAQDMGALMAAEQLAKWPGVEVTILHLVSADRRAATDDPSNASLATIIEKRFPPVATGEGARPVHMQVVQTQSPIDKVVEESHRYDLILLGMSPTWQAREGWLTAKQESVAQQSRCSVMIVRAGNPAPRFATTSHANADAPNPAALRFPAPHAQ